MGTLSIMPLHEHAADVDATIELRPQFARAAATTTLPTHRLPEDGCRRETAAQVVTEELLAARAEKNMVDGDEDPRTAELERRCVNILADLWGASLGEGETATGCSTTDSSEACLAAAPIEQPGEAAERVDHHGGPGDADRTGFHH